ncbi:beta-1,4-xylosyltransferase IRX9-like [Telopea speciosissima]|uniref:beta-1,4-xylosyltransferase IRX9-like n=1 Tax=Telopea speciosissima TaxID=54955 RepID=UPI001CC6CF0B|nr:beta-1,4-xylosyltransferase IRX9-like [Telopea speciosissima]
MQKFRFREMGSVDRSKKRVQLWKKAAFHFILCFIMGFFTGFTPTSRTSIFSGFVIASNQSMKYQEISPEMQPSTSSQEVTLNRSLMAETPIAVPTNLRDSSPVEIAAEEIELIPRKVLVIVTPTRSNDRLQGALLRRMSTTLKLVPPPLLWIVVESQSDSSEVSEILRKTGVMYRHLVSRQTFTDPEAEMDHQRNFALNHIEQHRLGGIVHFAGLSNFYDLDFFEEIREIEVFGAWPIALVSANRQRVVIEGPVCDSSQVIGWNARGTNDKANPVAPIHISSFAFNSSILWDPERWGRPSIQDSSQNPMKFVQQVVLEDESKLKGIPEGDCSKIMLWNINIPRQIISHLPNPSSPSNGRRR